MVKLRKFVAYRRLERPYTRTSKYRKLAYIRGKPNLKVVRFDMGNVQREYESTFHLVSKDDVQIRHEAIEASRLTANRLLDKTIGKPNFHLRVRIYPHHVLRMNPIAGGAGADRFSTGMSHSFGIPIGLAARVRKKQTILTLRIDKEHTKLARLALKRSSYKLPCQAWVVEEPKKAAMKTAAKKPSAKATTA